MLFLWFCFDFFFDGDLPANPQVFSPFPKEIEIKKLFEDGPKVICLGKGEALGLHCNMISFDLQIDHSPPLKAQRKEPLWKQSL